MQYRISLKNILYVLKVNRIKISTLNHTAADYLLFNIVIAIQIKSLRRNIELKMSNFFIRSHFEFEGMPLCSY